MRSSHTFKSLLAALLLAPIAAAQTTKPAVTLHVGDAAPAMQIAKWYKGTPVDQFKPGELYVVEFWATWCGPCKKSIPHLTDLAKKYDGKITFIGVDAYERPDDASQAGVDALVQPFVDKMGDQMAYNVATDGVTGNMVRTWLTAAGKSTIPTAFVIDRTGKIAYIGHPMELDNVLAPLVAGTWDLAAEAKRESTATATGNQQTALLNSIFKPLRAGDMAAALAASDKALAAMPSLASDIHFITFRCEVLAKTDPAALVKYTLELTAPDGVITKEPDLNFSVLRMLPLDANSVALSQAEYKTLADALAPSMAVIASPVPVQYAKFAELNYRAGDSATAAKNQEKALALLKDVIAKKTGPHTPHDEEIIKQYQDRVYTYRAGHPVENKVSEISPG